MNRAPNPNIVERICELAPRTLVVALGAVVALFAVSGCSGYGNSGGSSSGNGSGSGSGDAYTSQDDGGNGNGSGGDASSSDDGSGSGNSDGNSDNGDTWTADTGGGDGYSGDTGPDKWQYCSNNNRQWIGTEQQLQWMEDDVLNIDPPAEREDIRYISIRNQWNNDSVDCGQINKLRDSISFVVNSLSQGQGIVKPEWVDKYHTIYRLDLDDYNWDAATWQQIIDIYPYAIKYDPDSELFPIDEEVAERLRDETNTEIPYVQGDWFVDETTKAPLYYDLLELAETLPGLENDVGIDIQQNIDDEEVDRSGFTNSGPSEENRVIERHELDGGLGAFWISYDFQTSAGEQNIFENPIGFEEDGGEIIFNLDNGLQGYFVFANNGDQDRLNKAPQAVVTDPSRPDNAVQTAISCMGCHNGSGIISKKDEVRDYAKANLAGGEREQVLALYPKQATLDNLYKEDGERFLQSKSQAGLPAGINSSNSSSTTVLNVVLRHEEEMNLQRVSTNLGISKQTLENELSASFEQLPQPVKKLRNGGEIARDTYEDVEDQVVCAINLGQPINANGDANDNNEVVVNCDDVL